MQKRLKIKGMKDLDLLHEELETRRKSLRDVDDSIKRINGNEKDK